MAAMCDAYEVNCRVALLRRSARRRSSRAHFAAVVPNLPHHRNTTSTRCRGSRSSSTQPPVIENGEFVLPTGPGWGTDVNEDELRAHAATRA